MTMPAPISLETILPPDIDLSEVAYQLLNSQLQPGSPIVVSYVDNTSGICPVESGLQVCTPGQNIGRLMRRLYLIHYIICGRGLYTRWERRPDGGVFERTERVLPGQVFFIRPDEYCMYEADEDEPWAYVYISFIGPTIERFMSEHGFNASGCPLVFDYPDHSLISDILLLLLAHGWTPEQMSYRATHVITGLMAKLLRSFQAPESVAADGLNSNWSAAPPLVVMQTLEHIRAHYADEQLTIAQLVERAAMSRSQFFRVFKGYVGCSPQDYLINYRLQKAMHQLMRSDETVESVAERYGFRSANNFYRIFVKRMKMSPKQWQKRAHYKGAGL